MLKMIITLAKIRKYFKIFQYNKINKNIINMKNLKNNYIHEQNLDQQQMFYQKLSHFKKYKNKI